MTLLYFVSLNLHLDRAKCFCGPAVCCCRAFLFTTRRAVATTRRGLLLQPFSDRLSRIVGFINDWPERCFPFWVAYRRKLAV